MKRYNGLYQQICSFDNLVAAAYRARCGRRWRPDVLAFHFQQERRLLELRAELLDKSYRPGPYRAFWIRDPKRRLISAAPYRDRNFVRRHPYQAAEKVLRGARRRQAEAYPTRRINDLRADVGYALACQRSFSATRYALKCDIEKYLPSIDHRIMLERIERKIKCPDTLWLIERIVANSNAQEEAIRYFPGDTLFTPIERRRGIPIGNLTSQFFANVYLDGSDHFCQERLGCAAYLRFADDFLVFANDKRWLAALPARMEEYLDTLSLHPRKRQIVPVARGVPFLGWQVHPDHRRLRRTTGVRIQRRLKELAGEQRRGAIGLHRVHAAVMSWIGHLKHGDTWGLRRRLFAAAVFGPERRTKA